MKKSLPYFATLSIVALGSRALAQTAVPTTAAPIPSAAVIPSAPIIAPSTTNVPSMVATKSSALAPSTASAPATSPQSMPQVQPPKGQGSSAAVAVPAAAPVNSPAPMRTSSGDDLLVQAARRLERRASVAAHLRYRVVVGGVQRDGVGNYRQQGSGEDLKIRLELQLVGQDAKLLQISDGRFLWTDRKLPTGRDIVRYDLRQLQADPDLAPPDFDKLDPGKANWSAVQPLLTAHSGGLPNLIASLQESFEFLPPQTRRLDLEPSDSSQTIKVPVYAVVGQWKPDRLAALLAKTSDDGSQDNPAPAKKTKPSRGAVVVPDRLPQEVLLLVGQADLFPYRIEYRQRETPTATSADGPPIPYELSVHPLVVLELSDVVFDQQIPPGQFDYNPGDADWVDQTATLLEHVRRARQSQIATRSPNDKSLPAR
jgi:hypothetical protein